MANFTPNKFDINSINGGQRFVDGDGITPDAINAPIESALFIQSLTENTPDVSEAGYVGKPTVSIVNATGGGVRFKFSNLKGEATHVYTYSFVVGGQADDGLDYVLHFSVNSNINIVKDIGRYGDIGFNDMISCIGSVAPYASDDVPFVMPCLANTPDGSYVPSVVLFTGDLSLRIVGGGVEMFDTAIRDGTCQVYGNIEDLG